MSNDENPYQSPHTECEPRQRRKRHPTFVEALAVWTLASVVAALFLPLAATRNTAGVIGILAVIGLFFLVAMLVTALFISRLLFRDRGNNTG